nr:GFA family protein [Sphingomonas sp. R-74633]
MASEPTDAGWCHCRTCQLNSGSPAMAFATVPAGDFVLISGTELIGSVASSETGERSFCMRCGTPLLMQDKGGATVDFSLATLYEPDRVQPGFHIYYDSRISWAEADDDLPRHPRSRSESGGV